MNNGFQPPGIHSTHCTGLSSIPTESIATEVNMTKFIQVRIFRTHIKNRNEIVVGKTFVQFIRQADSVYDFINKIECSSKKSRLMSRTNRVRIFLQQFIE